MIKSKKKRLKKKALKKTWTEKDFVKSVWGVMDKQAKKSDEIKALHKKLEEDISSKCPKK